MVYVFEPIFVVEPRFCMRIRDILETIVLVGFRRIVKIVTNGLLCLWWSSWGMKADKVE